MRKITGTCIKIDKFGKLHLKTDKQLDLANYKGRKPVLSNGYHFTLGKHCTMKDGDKHIGIAKLMSAIITIRFRITPYKFTSGGKFLQGISLKAYKIDII